MNNTSREDLNFLLGAQVEDFDMFGALEAYHTLMDVYLDLLFQLLAAEKDFKGSDKEAWIIKANYKANRTVEAARRFSRRYRELKEITAQAKLAALKDYLEDSDRKHSIVDVRKMLDG